MGPRIIEEQSYEEEHRDGQHPIAHRINAISELGSNLQSRVPMILSEVIETRSGSVSLSTPRSYVEAPIDIAGIDSPNRSEGTFVPDVDSASTGAAAGPRPTQPVGRDHSILVKENNIPKVDPAKSAISQPTANQTTTSSPAEQTSIEADATTTLMSELVGLQNISLGDDGDFAVFIANPTLGSFSNIVVKVELPVGV